MINDHNCSQICVELEGSFNCSCYPGYELQEDRTTCEGDYDNKLRTLYSNEVVWFFHSDIDECERGLAGCDHNCNNIVGSYFCTCMDGYELESDNHTCTGNE